MLMMTQKKKKHVGVNICWSKLPQSRKRTEAPCDDEDKQEAEEEVEWCAGVTAQAGALAQCTGEGNLDAGHGICPSICLSGRSGLPGCPAL